jgi:hypothetical protein
MLLNNVMLKKFILKPNNYGSIKNKVMFIFIFSFIFKAKLTSIAINNLLNLNYFGSIIYFLLFLTNFRISH